MKVHLIKKQSIIAFTEKHATSRSSFAYWLAIIKMADWNEPADIMATFGSADLLGNSCNRVVFDIAGNNFRMICKYAFGEKVVHLFVCWIGTHAEYDKICKTSEQYTINKY